ncbi:MAG TPA: LLM class F420-dependent oxidoreductase [Candidatus Dormibacteraeota bacterium]|nr:LLM class F420-dependent oxidoreductase [Candidatus Dormibacteraeota bacterium]
MRIGITVADFTWPQGAAGIGPTLAEIARTADEGGFASIWVMDHFFQIPMNGPVEHEMLEAYTTLGFLAGVTFRIRLGTLVTGVIYRHPGLLAKTVTTLDVLSQGRAWLGIGAAWNEVESRSLGVPFPRIAVRFEQLEETLRICEQMWKGDETPIQGKHFQLERPLNSPQALTRPHPPILIGGGGERKTLRLVARHADACNLFPSPELPHKLDVLRRHCETEGRDYDAIEKTAAYFIDVGEHGEKVDEVIAGLRWLAGMGIQTAIAGIKDAWRIEPVRIVAEKVLPAVADL